MAAELLNDVARRGPALAVVAHPDDESFGLGALLSGVADRGGRVEVLCFTQGEASTLGAGGDLAGRRRDELHAAAAVLGVGVAALLDFADGALSHIPTGALGAVVDTYVDDAATVIVFEPGGVTGHPDHRAVTAATEKVAERRGLAALEWGVSPEVASALNTEFGTAFVALLGSGSEDVVVERTKQQRAIACHDSQVSGNSVLARRLELAGDIERIRMIPGR